MIERMKNTIMITIMLVCGLAVYVTTVTTPEIPMSYKISGLIFIIMFVFGILFLKYPFFGSSSSEEE